MLSMFLMLSRITFYAYALSVIQALVHSLLATSFYGWRFWDACVDVVFHVVDVVFVLNILLQTFFERMEVVHIFSRGDIIVVDATVTTLPIFQYQKVVHVNLAWHWLWSVNDSIY